MAYEHKEGGGALFKNDKGGVETRPDYKGDIKINGTLYELAAWIREGNKGKFMSLSAKVKEPRVDPGSSDPSNMHGPDLDDEIPF